MRVAPKVNVRAWTLVELLIVTVVLAISMAVLLPALASAKARARRIECISRLKQWNVSFTEFAQDNDGWIARECYEPLGEVTINNWSQVKGKVQPDGRTDSRDVWYNALPSYLGHRPTLDYAAFAERPNFFDRRLLIHCAAARFPEHALLPTYMFPLFSVAMNSQLIQSGPSIRLSAIEQRDTARIVLFLDNLLEGEEKVHPAQENSHLGQPGAYATRFSPRHQRGGDLAFADGHVSWFRGSDVVETNEDSALLGGPILPPRDIIWEIYP